MAPACGGGPSNWNCLLATIEPILPLASVKTPSFKVNSKVPEFLHELSFKDGEVQEAEEGLAVETVLDAEEEAFSELLGVAVALA